MRYMMLVYSTEGPDGLTPEEMQRLTDGHRRVMEESARKGVLVAAEPLAPTRAATTVRHEDGKPLIIDGPFAETKEHLAGYYIIDCRDLDEAIEWASQIPTGCHGSGGCIEIRPLRWQPQSAPAIGEPAVTATTP